MPMVFSQVNDHWYQHRECLFLIGFKNIKEIVILEEAHSSISHLEMDSSNALDNSFEQSWDKMLHLVNLAYFKNLLELGQEKCFLDAIGKWPIFEKTLEEWDGQSSIFGQEQH
mgnify:CR=1 FL=1